MILLEYSNKIISETLENKFKFYPYFITHSSAYTPTQRRKPEGKDKYDALDVNFVDFDGIRYHLGTDCRDGVENGERSKVILSIAMDCFAMLERYGVRALLASIYQSESCTILPEPISPFDLSLGIDLAVAPESNVALIASLAMLKRNCLAAPFYQAFQLQVSGQVSNLMTIPYRDREAIYVRAHADRVTVIFSTVFRDPGDVIYGKVFLKEFVDARKQHTLQNAPQVLFSKEPPMELKELNIQNDADDIGYVTFVLFPRHFAAGEKQEEVISLIQTFRDYLHYHIKCSKAYLHTRMREKVRHFLKVLNRASKN